MRRLPSKPYTLETFESSDGRNREQWERGGGIGVGLCSFMDGNDNYFVPSFRCVDIQLSMHIVSKHE